VHQQPGFIGVEFGLHVAGGFLVQLDQVFGEGVTLRPHLHQAFVGLAGLRVAHQSAHKDLVQVSLFLVLQFDRLEVVNLDILDFHQIVIIRNIVF